MKSLLSRSVLSVINLFSVSYCLYACSGPGHRINYIVEGHYEGINLRDDGTKFYLEVVPIEEEEYLRAAGLNVVEDLVKPSFYSLSFYMFDDNNEKILFDFYNLKDAYNGATGTLICYLDDYESRFKPLGVKSEYERGRIVYNVSMCQEKRHICYSKLYRREQIFTKKSISLVEEMNVR